MSTSFAPALARSHARALPHARAGAGRTKTNPGVEGEEGRQFFPKDTTPSSANRVKCQPGEAKDMIAETAKKVRRK